MKQIPYKYFIVALMFTSFSFVELNAQQGTVEVNQDKQIDVLLKVKKDVNATEANYKIKIYSGNRQADEKEQMKLINSLAEWFSTKKFKKHN